MATALSGVPWRFGATGFAALSSLLQLVNSSHFNPGSTKVFVMRGEGNPDSYAVRAKPAKNQRLILEIRSSATDTEEKAAKHLTCADKSVFEAG